MVLSVRDEDAQLASANTATINLIVRIVRVIGARQRGARVVEAAYISGTTN
jgi:hypothetical protein